RKRRFICLSGASCKTPRFRLLFIGPGRAVFLFLFLLPEKERRRFWFTFLSTQKVRKFFRFLFYKKEQRKSPGGCAQGFVQNRSGGKSKGSGG
ncbi:MAG: hypothetical protein Q4P84_08125, partial [Elusimicrobiales bacterium]|nr:hypothetical protein [Elusimicrobiales bacterium]